MNRNRLFWIMIIVVILVVTGLEIAIGDLIIDSTTQSISSLGKVLIVLITGSVITLGFVEGLRRVLLKESISAAASKSTRRSPHRALSILPLVRAMLFGVIVVLTILVALSEMGINIGPLLTGAGVLGLTLGLGAQSLLRDIFAGVFFTIDDAFRIGEYVEIGTLRGTVERVSLRSMQIRHHRGALQTIPYGTIASVSNFSRDWVIVKLQFQLPLDTDILKVKKIVKGVSGEFLANEEFGPFMLEPLKFQGIDNVDLYGLTVRLKFMAVPGEQFVMRREMLRFLQKAFKQNGIEFAKRSVVVNTTDPANLVAAADDEEEKSTTTG